MTDFLKTTTIADCDAPSIQDLIQSRGWRTLDDTGQIGAIYSFVKDEIPFGYNRSDDLKASEVLADGYGQCNTKGNLLVALLRGVGQKTRVRGFTIFKDLQLGAIPFWLERFTPERILHSWVEVFYDGHWVPLEGFILDQSYLSALQNHFSDHVGAFCGYGVATKNFQRPEVEWNGSATYIQREGIADDFGLFDDPDSFYAHHGTNLRGLRRLAYGLCIRHIMNRRVEQIRQGRRLPK